MEDKHQNKSYVSEDQVEGNLEVFCSMVNFCAVLGCSNRSNREKDKGYFRVPAIVSRSKPKKQALSVERRATWLARIRREDLVGDATELYRVCGDYFISGT